MVDINELYGRKKMNKDEIWVEVRGGKFGEEKSFWVGSLEGAKFIGMGSIQWKYGIYEWHGWIGTREGDLFLSLLGWSFHACQASSAVTTTFDSSPDIWYGGTTLIGGMERRSALGRKSSLFFSQTGRKSLSPTWYSLITFIKREPAYWKNMSQAKCVNLSRVEFKCSYVLLVYFKLKPGSTEFNSS